MPFVWSNSQAPVSEDVLKIARALVGEAAVAAAEVEQDTAQEVHLRVALTIAMRSVAREMSTMSLLKRIESAEPGPGGRAPARPRRSRRRCAAAPGGPAAARRAVLGAADDAAARMLSQVPVRESFRDTKFRIQQRVISDLDPKLDLTNQVEVRRQIEEIFSIAVDEEGLALTRAERVRMLEQITDEIVGLGPLEPLLRDESITEVMVNGPRQVYIERAGKLELTNVTFQNDEHVMRIIDRIIAPIGRRVDESSPMVDARLTDGSRVNAIIPPLSLVGPGHHHPEVRGLAVHGRRPHPLRHRDPGDVRLPEGLRRGAPQHLRLRRHRLGQDDDAQRALVVHPQRRAHRHHRGRRRAAAPPGARGHARVAAAQHRGQGRHPHPRARAQRPAHAARPHRRRRVSAPARRWTCSRP